VPSLVQQFCALELPERVLERLCKEDAPAKDLQRAAAVLCMLSCCKFGQVRTHWLWLGILHSPSFIMRGQLKRS